MMKSIFKSLVLIALIFQIGLQTAFSVDKPYVNVKESEKITNDIDFRLIKKVDLSSFNFPSCQDVPVLLSRCIPSACIIKAPYGDVIVQIKSNSGNQCEYSEKTIGVGGFDCKIPTAELEMTEKAFQKRYDYLALQSVDFQMSPAEVQANKQIFEKYCVFKKDFALTSFITIGALENKERNIDPEIKAALENNSSRDSKNQIKTSNPSSIGLEQQINIKSINLQNFTSIIYTNDELEFITRLVEGLGDISEVRSSYGSVISKGPGVYTLDSLIYRTKDSWTAWLNGTRYDEKNIGDTVRVIGANKNSATFKWEVPNIERVSPNWKEYLVAVNNNKYASEKSDIVLESEDEKIFITFRLQPRQTFIAQTMQITDGK